MVVYTQMISWDTWIKSRWNREKQVPYSIKFNQSTALLKRSSEKYHTKYIAIMLLLYLIFKNKIKNQGSIWQELLEIDKHYANIMFEAQCFSNKYMFKK